MKFNLIGLGAVCALAFGLAFSSFAGSATDTDGDGVPDTYDNCVTTDNGPLQASGACDAQEDNNLDGYGNPCDFDTNNDGAVGFDDVAAFVVAVSGPNLDFDSNCDGAIGFDDVASGVGNVGVPIGPSGLGCAGSVPCSAE